MCEVLGTVEPYLYFFECVASVFNADIDAEEARAMLESLYEVDSAAPGPELVDGTAPATEGEGGGEDEGPAER